MFLFSIVFCLKAQTLERVLFMTDRSVYYAGEEILFYADLISESHEDCPGLSSVLYTEIIDRNGMSILKKKTLIDHCKSSGIIEIPKELITGVYLIRSYTKFEKNLKPNKLTTSVLRIINPTQKAEQTAKIPVLEQSTNASTFQLSITKEEDSLRVEAKEGSIKILALSMIGKQLAEQSWLAPKFKSAAGNVPVLTPSILPETRGVDIRGNLVLKPEHVDQFPILIYAATLGETRQFHTVAVDSSGAFMVSFSQIVGSQKIYISSSIDAEILVETDFSTAIPQYNWTRDTLYKSRLKSYNEAYVKTQIPVAFRVEENATGKDPIALAAPFTNPTEHILLSDFVPLKNLEEAFAEIVPFVFIRKSEGSRQLKMYDFKTKNAVEHPLILVDNIAFQDHEQVLKIPISKVFAIDVFAEPLLFGDHLFEGIVNIKTEEGLLGGLELPNNCIAIDYQTANSTNLFHFIGSQQKLAFGNTVQFQRNETKNNLATLEMPSGVEVLNYDLVIYYMTESGILKSEVLNLKHSLGSD